MKRLITYTVAITLACTILGVSTWLPFQMMEHAKTHSHHETATHANPLCTLFCSVGQMAQIADPTPKFGQSSAFNVESPTFTSYLRIHVSPLLARGPPSSSISILNF